MATQKKKRSKVLFVVLLLLALALTYCKLDLCEIITAEFEPSSSHIRIPNLEVYPYLLSNSRNMQSSFLFKCRVNERAPLSFRMAFRDFGKKYSRVRMVSIVLRSADRSWLVRLRTPPPYYESWRQMEPETSTSDFNETHFYAVIQNSSDEAYLTGDIEPPQTLNRIYVDAVFELQSQREIQSISERLLIIPEHKKYFSYFFAEMMST